MGYRERRPWTPEEDELLRAAVIKEEPGNQSPSKWFAIATHVPGRTNKDCRKRWFARMTGDIVKGSWAAEEDAKLIAAVAKHGTKWSMVATMVHSRNSDQCAKRWSDSLDPNIDRASWLPEQDQILLDAVNQHGTCWKKIVQTYFPGKTGLSAKNRYTSLSRHQDISQTLRSRPKDDDVKFELASTASRMSNERFYPSPFSKRAHSNEARLRSNSPHSIYRSPSVENSKWDDPAETCDATYDHPPHAYRTAPVYPMDSDGYWNGRYPSHFRIADGPAHSTPTAPSDARQQSSSYQFNNTLTVPRSSYAPNPHGVYKSTPSPFSKPVNHFEGYPNFFYS